MNCCNEFGQCQQGHGCPAHTTPAEPNQPWDTLHALYVPVVCLISGIAIGGAAILIYLSIRLPN